jgi:hypothetical protein
MTAAEFKDFCKTLDTKFDNYYCGRLDSKKNKSLGIYSLRNNCKIPIGGEDNRKTFEVNFSLLIHWDNNYNNTETQAKTFQKELQTIQNVAYGDYNINFIQLHFSEPIDVDTDAKGIFERVIEVTVYYSEVI